MKQDLQKIADECREKRCFSKKIGKGCFGPKGEFIPLPTGISRKGKNFIYSGSWIVRTHTRNLPPIIFTFLDSDVHCDYMVSLSRAIEKLKELKNNKVFVTGNHLNQHESKSKKLKFDIVGVSFHLHKRRMCRLPVPTFTASCGYKRKKFTLPCIYTQAQFDSKLKEAIAWRKEMEKQRLQEVGFDKFK